MTERPIIFNDSMSLAIIEGRKTVTRRPVLPMPGLQSKWLTQDLITRSPSLRTATLSADLGSKLGAQMEHPDGGPLGWVRSPCAPGDRLWVREAWRVSEATIGLCEYRCGGSAEPAIDPAYEYEATLERWQSKTRGGKWAPSIHMPRWASRTTLDVLTVRVERLQSMAEEDARAEGFATLADFIATWDAIYPAMPWSSNPWVWVIEFKRAT